MTPSERYLAELCKKSFLTLWSYPNLFRNQGKVGGKGDGKELSDLVVICGDDIIIFSDKSCAYPNTGKKELDWSRWFRNSVADSVRQAFGAERWLKEFPDQIYLDRACTQRLPIAIPRGPNVRYHRVVVALGAKARCQQEHGGGSGSLLLLSSIKGEAAHTQPFTIGQVKPNKGYVHVFDDVTLDIILRHLDTITDFVSYLTAKENLLTSRDVIASGEEDLLAFFLHYADDTGKHYFNVPKSPGNILVDGNYWNDIRSHPEFVAKQRADKPSYLWDSIIEVFTQHLLGGTLREGPMNTGEVELGLRYMAKESRFARRVYADSFIEARNRTGRGQIWKRCIPSFEHPDTCYIFLVADWDGNDLDTYRKVRLVHLRDYSFVYSQAHREYTRVIGIATESNSNHGESHDLIFAEYGPWTPELEKEAIEIQELRGWLKPEKTKFHHHTDYEFPPMPKSIRERHDVGSGRVKIGRNDPCPCGSGKKYKKCCMKGR
jgi:hypothetical protein